MSESSRIALKTFAVLIALRALTNVVKLFDPDQLFVCFGTVLTGDTMRPVAASFGVAMLLLAYGVWRLRPWALPAAVGYALYVTLNIALYAVANPLSKSELPPAFWAAFIGFGLGITWGGAALLWVNRDRLET
jgi:hypothetical protein